MPPAIVQFNSFMYFVDESEGVAELEVMRIGDLSQPSEVSFRTQDATAIAGRRYEAASGRIAFAKGDASQTIRINILTDAIWNTTLEFAVILENPHGAYLGRYLFQTRVKVMDEDRFPSSEAVPSTNPSDQVKGSWKLMYHYFKLNMASPVVKSGTLKTIAVEQVHNLYFLLKLFISQYLIDYVLYTGEQQRKLLTGNREADLIILQVATLLPFALLHFLDVEKLKWKVGGASRMMLQKSLLRKFLNYDEISRANVSESDLILAMTRDCHDLVGSGFMSAIEVLRLLGQLLCIFIYQVIEPFVFARGEKLEGSRFLRLIPIFVYPILIFVFMECRVSRAMTVERSCNDKRRQVINRVSRTVGNYRLIADYSKRPFFVAWFERTVGEFNKTLVDKDIVFKNNEYFAPWITVLILVLYTYFQGKALVETRSVTLGAFLTTLEILKTIGNVYGGMYTRMLDMQDVFGALARIVMFMNFRVDLQARQRASLKCQAMTRELRKALLEEGGVRTVPPADLLKIKVEDIELDFMRGKGTAPFNNVGSVLRFDSFELGQGQIITLMGPRGQGKSSLLKVLSGVLLPETGTCFIPSHLRVLHVPSEPLFYAGSLFNNLIFGLSSFNKRVENTRESVASKDTVVGVESEDEEEDNQNQDGSVARVKDILRKLGLTQDQRLMAHLESDAALNWHEELPLSQRHLLCLARAFISNPEVLCVHRPLLSCNESQSYQVMRVMREFVEKKGLELPDSSIHLRRPRTVIMTSEKLAGMEMADTVLGVRFEIQRGIWFNARTQVNVEKVDASNPEDVNRLFPEVPSQMLRRNPKAKRLSLLSSDSGV
eukprot:TRINITY_DN12219_c0_g1_i1.p1 TRINITY_DN12219_c0_g1~~TRINITY_DN12219_c0_g1_i1.p1  ORF type:complete len:951 (-),score=122.96 TRINITY_DN12219_c0_g1_i1:105-2594(-)